MVIYTKVIIGKSILNGVDRKMKMSMKRKIAVFFVLMFIMSSNSISLGIEMASPVQIDTKGITFNTGRSSDQIRLLKDFFRARNEENVPWGYVYDDRTRELVKNYQELMGLQADGIASKATIDRINQEIIEKDLQIALRTISTDINDDMIVINKSSNTLYYLKDGVVQETYPVATGKTISLTPNGKFKAAVKYKNRRWNTGGIPGGAPNNPLGTRWIGIGYRGIDSHGVHGNSSPGSIGTYASAGCIRMFNKDVEELYEKVNINTPIWIGTEDILINYGVKFAYKEREVVKGPVLKEIELDLVLNGEKLKLEDKVINKKGTTYYPFREIVEFVNGEVAWDNENKKVKGSLGENYVEFQLNNNEYRNNDKYRFLPEGQEPFINKGKTYIPIRYFMEALDYYVNWDESSKTIIISDEPWE